MAAPRNGGFLGLGRKSQICPHDAKIEKNLRFMLVGQDYVVQEHSTMGDAVISHGKQAVIRLFGLTIEGASVMVMVHGFEPYMYIKILPDSITGKYPDIRPEHLDDLRRALNSAAGTPEPSTSYYAQGSSGFSKKKYTPYTPQSVFEEPSKFSRSAETQSNAFGSSDQPGDTPDGLEASAKMSKSQKRKWRDDFNDTEAREEDDLLGDVCYDTDSDDEDDDNEEELEMVDPRDDEGDRTFSGAAGGAASYHIFDAASAAPADLMAAAGMPAKQKGPPVVERVELVYKHDLYGFSDKGTTPFIKVYTRIPANVPTMRATVEAGLTLSFGDDNDRSKSFDVTFDTTTFESNIDYVLRMMVDRGIVGMGWVEITGEYDGPFDQPPLPPSGLIMDPKMPTSDVYSRAKFTNFEFDKAREYKRQKMGYIPLHEQVPLPVTGDSVGSPRVIHVRWNNIKGVPLKVKNTLPDGTVKEDTSGSAMAPLRILTEDIECAGYKGRFPDPFKDPVITIAMHMNLESTQENPKGKREVTVILQLGTTTYSRIRNEPRDHEVHILTYDRETDLLKMHGALVRLMDPDIYSGYNITDFDDPYLLARCQFLGLLGATCWGRVRGERSIRRDSTFTSKAFGTKDIIDIIKTGRGKLDMLSVLLRDEKFSSYTLNSTAQAILGDAKEDMPHQKLEPSQLAGDEEREEIDDYCGKDAWLPRRMMDKKMKLFNYAEMARITGVPFNYLLDRGQQIKVVSQILRDIADKHFVTPALRPAVGGGDVAYEGATVIEPKRGYHYDKPVATLDFSSLYPSIMQAGNMCYTTWIKGGVAEAKRMGLKGPDKYGERGMGFAAPGDDYIITPYNDTVFVCKHIRKGILPGILDDLIAARKVAKKDLKKAQDELDKFMEAVFDGRQLAIKVSANSVYGFTGATVGKLPLLAISGSVTAFGRVGLLKTKDLVEEKYPGSEIIYGDTDSVMIKFNAPQHILDAIKKLWHNLETKDEFAVAMDWFLKIGAEAAALISEIFPDPMKLEFEKVYFPYLLINKKRYAGVYWTKSNMYDKIDVKGLEVSRRDNCKALRDIMKSCIHEILVMANPEKAAQQVRDLVASLWSNDIDLSQLIISKKLAYDPYIPIGTKGAYSNKQIHVTVANNMRRRDPASAPGIGDRVPFVVIQGNKWQTVSSLGEDPSYVMMAGLRIDPLYYVKKQLEKPLGRIFFHIFGPQKTKELFEGKHALKRVSTVSAAIKFHREAQADSFSSGGSGTLFSVVENYNNCIKCKIPLKKDAPDQGLCKNCQPKREAVTEASEKNVSDKQKQVDEMFVACMTCRKQDEKKVKDCNTKECPKFYRRWMYRKQLTELHTQHKRLQMW